MAKIALYLLLGLAAGFALATLTGQREPGVRRPRTAGELDIDALERRVADLESALAAAGQSRVELETELAAMAEQIAALAGSGAADGTSPLAAGAASLDPGADGGEQAAPPDRRFALGTRALDPDAQIQRFINAGLTPDRARFVMQRTEELRMELLQARYEAARDGVPLNFRSGLDLNAALRDELGDSDYEKYLTGLGRPTTIGVGSVLASSPAAQAGIEPGDEIVGYDGERVYAMRDLNRLIYEGQPGESVAIDVVRSGQTIQLYVPRGPLGVTGSGRGRRRP